MRLKIELLPIEVLRASVSSFHNLREVVMDYFLFGLMLSHPPLIIRNAMNVVFPPSRIDPTVKEFGVGISFDVSDSSTLLFACFFKHGQAYDPSLKAGPKITLRGGEKPSLLSNVEA